MKATASEKLVPPAPKKFEPIEVIILLETEDEFKMMWSLAKTNVSVPEAVRRTYPYVSAALIANFQRVLYDILAPFKGPLR